MLLSIVASCGRRGAHAIAVIWAVLISVGLHHKARGSTVD